MKTRPWDSPFPSKITPTLIRRWTKDYPTPFYVYDQATLLRRIEEVKEFPHPAFSAFTPRYAIKANPNRALIELFDRSGISFDASSGFEVERLLSIGVSPEKIMLTAQQIPTPDEKFRNFFRRGLIYNATSLRQLSWYGRLCPGKNISLRINPGFGSGMNVKTTVGGDDSGFGIWHEYYPEILKLCRRYRLKVRRIHTHVGSGSDSKTWEEVTVATLNLLQYFPTAHILNIGGGFKVARHSQERSADLFFIGKKVSQQMEAYSRKTSRTFDVEIEPGTYYIAEAGLLVAQVEDVISTGVEDSKLIKRFIKLNTGMNDLIRPTLYHSRHHLDIIPSNPRRRKAPRSFPYIVIGHCCESGDQISQHLSGEIETIKAAIVFPPPKPGDPVIIHGVGAYGSAMSSRYNSFPLIAEYLFDGTELRVIRKAEALDDILDKEVSLNKKIR